MGSMVKCSECDAVLDQNEGSDVWVDAATGNPLCPTRIPHRPTVLGPPLPED